MDKKEKPTFLEKIDKGLLDAIKALEKMQESEKNEIESLDKRESPENFNEGLSKDENNTETSLAWILKRIGSAEADIEKDRNEILSIKQSIIDKFNQNFSLIIGVLFVGVITIVWLVWQSFWMYPQMIKEYSEKSEVQNTKIELQNNQIQELKDDISEIKNRIEKEIDRRIILETTQRKNTQ